MTDPGSVLLDREQLERAFTALGDRLVRRGVVADVFIAGGAAMALAYDATRVTRDVDSLFVPHGIVLEEAGNVAQEHGLPMWWQFSGRKGSRPPHPWQREIIGCSFDQIWAVIPPDDFQLWRMGRECNGGSVRRGAPTCRAGSSFAS